MAGRKKGFILSDREPPSLGKLTENGHHERMRASQAGG
jgi:hypothetical protein